MSAKKRTSRKGGKSASGLSGNPDWVQWCIEQSGITGNAAARALAAARAEASRLATAGGDYSKDDQDRPYRRQE